MLETGSYAELTDRLEGVSYPRIFLAATPMGFFFSILSQREFWFLAAVASGLLSWGHLISSDYRQLDFTDTI